MNNFDGCNTEKRFLGRVAVGGRGTLIGKISFLDEGYTEGSILLVYDKDAVDGKVLSLCPPIAIVAVRFDEDEPIGGLCSFGVPCIVLDFDESLNKSCKNKVALIDAERGTLTIDPSIETINFYSAKKQKNSYYLPCDVGYALQKEDGGIRMLDFEHFLVPSSFICEGGDLFENAVLLWEERCPELLVVDMPIPKDSEGAFGEFEEHIEELFCASLYGSFALALSDFSCEEEISRSIKILQKSFCLLEAEGREFNGYIPRGLIFSSPLWLMRSSPVSNPDFIILDFDKLLPALFSMDAKEIIKKEKLLKKELLGVFERYLIGFAPRCEIYAKSKDFFGTRLLQDSAKALNIKLIFR